MKTEMEKCLAGEWYDCHNQVFLDLSVMLKATYDEANNCWRLNGVKRFITNGDANLHLVLARSEEGTKDGRGLSMFIYDKNEGGVDVRRIENKLGIHGSPTCELVYKNAKAELCGDRKLGLIKYVMALMNGARLGIAAQSVGLSQAAYNEGLAYAKDRKQFGKAIIELTVEVHADITVRRYFLCLRKRICFTSSQTKRVFIIQIVFEIQAGQEIIFLDGIVSFRASTIHIVIHFNIYFVVFHSQIHNPTGSKLVGSLGISGMDILFYGIFI